jgi:hypothetical protein
MSQSDVSKSLRQTQAGPSPAHLSASRYLAKCPPGRVPRHLAGPANAKEQGPQGALSRAFVLPSFLPLGVFWFCFCTLSPKDSGTVLPQGGLPQTEDRSCSFPGKPGFGFADETPWRDRLGRRREDRETVRLRG